MDQISAELVLGLRKYVKDPILGRMISTFTDEPSKMGIISRYPFRLFGKKIKVAGKEYETRELARHMVEPVQTLEDLINALNAHRIVFHHIKKISPIKYSEEIRKSNRQFTAFISRLQKELKTLKDKPEFVRLRARRN